jgi:glycosyltransferase involved in cell wall biosynthesis
MTPPTLPDTAPVRPRPLPRAHPRRIARAVRARAVRRARRLAKAALYRYAAAPPREGAPERVVILIGSAWGMGGTIRAALNLAGWLAPSERVEVLSAYRRAQNPFMGAFPAGVDVIALDDQRKAHQKGARQWLAGHLRGVHSVLLHPADMRFSDYSLWSDIQTIRSLRGGRGVLIGTRPSLNLLIAQLDLPGWRTIGVEQMNLDVHVKPLRAAIKRHYGRLDALTVLTEGDAAAYRRLLGDRAPRIAIIPNTVKALEGGKADRDAKVVLAAGRLTPQKGYDMLIPAWRVVAAERPDWHLRILGRGQKKANLEGYIVEYGLEGKVAIGPASNDLAGEMERASIYALSSRYEGFPLVLLEAMGKGMAPVAFDCPTGPADIIDDHRNGLLVPYKDVDALGRALLEMITDDELRHRCGVAAMGSAGDYTMEAVGPLWDALIAELRGAAARDAEPAAVGR